MKKNSLTTALLAGLAGAAGLATTAHAVNLNPDGLGQALVYPYYTVNGGNQTILSVVNTSDDVKAVKVRFLESRNSREVLDFNLYLSEFDVWTGAVFLAETATGRAGLVTNDNSCTVPQIKGNTSLPLLGTLRYAPFLNFGYTGTNNDGGGTTFARGAEGHFEMIEMGILQFGTGAGALADEATHGSNGVPANCARLVAAWDGGVWAQNDEPWINSPTGGLFGSAAVVDVANGTMLAYNPEAIDGFFDVPGDAADLHEDPGSLEPSLNRARTGSVNPPVTSYVFSSGTASTVVTSTWNRGIDAVSAIFMVDALYNEYTTDNNLGAETEWVVTFPTKNFYVDDVLFGGRVSLPTTGAPSGLRFALAPFAGYGFTRTSSAGLSGSFACESVDLTIFDREEGTPAGGGVIFSPPPPQAEGNALCEETNVIGFSQGTRTSSIILGSPNALFIDAPFVDGWLELSFPVNEQTGREPGFASSPVAGDTDVDVYDGLPATGFEAVNVINSNVTAGVLANYSGFFKHRGSRSITPSAIVVAQ